MMMLDRSHQAERLCRQALRKIALVQKHNDLCAKQSQTTAGQATSKQRQSHAQAIDARDAAIDRLERHSARQNAKFVRTRNVLFKDVDCRQQRTVEELTQALRREKQDKWAIDQSNPYREMACDTILCCCFLGLCLPTLAVTETHRALFWGPEHRLKRAIKNPAKFELRTLALKQEAESSARLCAQARAMVDSSR